MLTYCLAIVSVHTSRSIAEYTTLDYVYVLSAIPFASESESEAIMPYCANDLEERLRCTNDQLAVDLKPNSIIQY